MTPYPGPKKVLKRLPYIIIRGRTCFFWNRSVHKAWKNPPALTVNRNAPWKQKKLFIWFYSNAIPSRSFYFFKRNRNLCDPSKPINHNAFKLKNCIALFCNGWTMVPQLNASMNETYASWSFVIFSNCIVLHLVGNKANGRISKRVFQENKARQIFQKKNISYPLIRTRTMSND